jgi:hypothetical protein
MTDLVLLLATYEMTYPFGHHHIRRMHSWHFRFTVYQRLGWQPRPDHQTYPCCIWMYKDTTRYKSGLH